MSYFAIRRTVEPANRWEPPKGAWKGGPQGTSQAPHLYLSRAKAEHRCGPGWEVVEVRLEEVAAK